jgi:hypothetical protein
VLALRAEIEGQWDGKAAEPDKFLDLSIYERALKRVKDHSIFQSKDETEEVVKVRRRVWPIC